MKADFYLLFSTTEIANEFLGRLHNKMQGMDIWAEPNIHPFDHRAIVPWNNDYLAQYIKLLENIDQISLEQARDLGFIFGRIKGPYAHARAKLEEAQLLYDALSESTSLPNFPAYRALFFGFLGATYALKEALCKSSKRLGKDADDWYEDKFKNLKNNPVVWAFYQMNNENKHQQKKDLPLRSFMKIGSLKISGCPQGVRIFTSNEGIIGIIHEGTVRERVSALGGIAEFDWQILLEMPEHGVNGLATPLAEQVLKFYEQFVFEARKAHGGEPELEL